MRNNPLVTHTGKYIAQNNGSDLWYHGSSCEFGAARLDEPLTMFMPDKSLKYQATFFSSKRLFAFTFAEAGMPYGYDFGCVYSVRIKDVRLFDVDDIFVNRDLPNSPLTEEGEVFWQNMSTRLPRKGWFTRYKMHEIMHLFQGASFRAFDTSNTLTYSAMIATMRDLGYRGWIEYEGATLNIALLYPHEDAEIVDSFIVGGSRANPKEYHMAHVAPDEDDAPLWNVTANGVYPADFYGPRGLDYYGTGYPELDVEAYAIIRKAHGRRDQQVRVYRAVPKGVKTINVGDWVTIVRQYAKDHAIDLQGPGKDGTVISKIFNARDLFTDGNSMLEWGYDPQPYTQRSDREEWERWPGKARSNPWGKAGAGILFVCEEDGTMLLMHRSGSVEEPYTWGVPGGAVIGEGYHDWYFDVEPYTDEQLWEGAQRETWEECGSLPPSLNVSMVEDYFDFKKGDFIFRDFVVNLTKAQKDAWRIDIKNAQDAWENVDWGWFSLEDLPSPLHPGVRFIFDNLGI